jgi:hypothetical protein
MTTRMEILMTSRKAVRPQMLGVPLLITNPNLPLKKIKNHLLPPNGELSERIKRNLNKRVHLKNTNPLRIPKTITIRWLPTGSISKSKKLSLHRLSLCPIPLKKRTPQLHLLQSSQLSKLK